MHHLENIYRIDFGAESNQPFSLQKMELFFGVFNSCKDHPSETDKYFTKGYV